MTQATTAPPTKKVGPLLNRNYALLWIGQSISFIGDFVFDTTLVVWIAIYLGRRADGTPETWAPLAVSGVLVAAAVPVLLVGPLAGVFVDRWDKRRTMLRMDVLRAVLIASLLLTVPQPLIGDGHASLLVALMPALTGPNGNLPVSVHLSIIYAIVFLASACAQFFGPARIALVGDVVTPEQLPQASGLSQASQGIAGIIGPPIAAPLLIVFGVQWALGINALSFIISFLSIRAMRVSKEVAVTTNEQHDTANEFVAGLRFYFGNRVLRTLLITFVVATFGTGAINALNVFFTINNLHADPRFLGVIDAMLGIGIIGGSFIAGSVGHRIGVARLLWGSTLILGILIVVLTRLTSLIPALPLFFIFGIFQAGLNITIGPLILRVTPREMVGRVIGVFQPIIMATSLISIALSGYLASNVLKDFHVEIIGFTFGPIDTIFVFSGVLAVLAGIYAMINLRDVEAPPSNTPNAESASLAA